MSGDNYPIDFNVSKHRISLIIHLRQKWSFALAKTHFS